jgi:hypothetical protein
MMRYQIPVTRQAQCTLETTVEVDADSIEEAEFKAIRMSEEGLEASSFTVRSIDLSAFQGSSNVEGEEGVK